MTKKTNTRNAGAKPKYKQGTETMQIHPTIPKACKSKVLEAIEVAVKDYKNEI